MSSRESLVRIMRYALVKVVPSLFNLALIPYLLVALGEGGYGLYSIWLGYTMLVANAVAAVVAQPMYRYMPSQSEGRDYFRTFALSAATAAGAITLGVVLAIGAPVGLSIGFATLAIGTVLGSTANVAFIVAQQVGRVAIYEGIRILTVLLALVLPVLCDTELLVDHVVFGLAASNAVPLAIMIRRSRLARLEIDWLRRTAGYGVRSAIWLLLAGLPIVGAKSLLIGEMPEDAFGSYTAIADLTYRGFATVNAALTMWAFPLLARQYDSGDLVAARRTLRFASVVYAAGGGVGLVVLLVTVHFAAVPVAALPGGLAAVIMISIASFAWHGMSIAHKPLEMTLSTTRMVLLLLCVVLAFFGISVGLIRLSPVNAFYAVTTTMAGVAFFYALIATGQRLER